MNLIEERIVTQGMLTQKKKELDALDTKWKRLRDDLTSLTRPIRYEQLRKKPIEIFFEEENHKEFGQVCEEIGTLHGYYKDVLEEIAVLEKKLKELGG